MSSPLPRAFVGTVASAVLAGALQMLTGIVAAEQPAVRASSETLDAELGESLKNLGDLEQLCARMAAESYGELVRKLNKPGIYHDIWFMSDQMFTQPNFSQILSSRRTHRLVALLTAKPADEARREALKLCDRLYEECKTTLDRILAHQEDPRAPANKQSLPGNALGFGAAVFAVAHVGTVDDVVDQLERLERMAQEMAKRADRQPGLFPAGAGQLLHSISTLDGACQVSLIAFAVSRSGEDKRALQGAVEGVLNEMQRGNAPLTDWDAPMTYFERCHFRSKDQIEATGSVTIYDWPSEKAGDFKWQRLKIAELAKTCCLSR